MTNIEKAKDITNETLGDFATSFLGMIDEYSEMFCTEAAFRMAEWKDHQFKEYLEERLSYATNIYEKSNHEDYNGGYMDAISEIIKELFKEE